MKRIAALAAVVVLGCSRNPASLVGDETAVHTLQTPAESPPDLPERAGRAELYANCLICHSVRYVATQPPFARKTWLAEVQKMKKVYGAPVSDQDAPKIVEYLVATHGQP